MAGAFVLSLHVRWLQTVYAPVVGERYTALLGIGDNLAVACLPRTAGSRSSCASFCLACAVADRKTSSPSTYIILHVSDVVCAWRKKARLHSRALGELRPLERGGSSVVSLTPPGALVKQQRAYVHS